MNKTISIKNNVSIKSFKNYILIVVFGILVVSSVLITIDTAATGAEVANLQKTESKLTDQKRVLEESLVKGVSMAELQQKSIELGFVQPANLVYVSNSQDMSAITPVAVLP